PGQADAARLLAHHRQLDRAQPLAALLGGNGEAEVAHLGELPPLRRLEAAGVVLHDPAAALQRRVLGEVVARVAARQRPVFGELEPHLAAPDQAWGRPRTRFAMMLRWTSEEPE